MMQEIERFFTNLFSGIFSRFKYDAIETVERKTRQAIDSRLNPSSEQHSFEPRSGESQPEDSKKWKEEDW
ncbi:hypothetical protein IQ250_00630 [Pseudanabaenaceae cyanobacterium LEGE 13415]|nr:hypothetical protein [Pseudanabaenaceae cyanobacterium LEGE 13415]